MSLERKQDKRLLMAVALMGSSALGILGCNPVREASKPDAGAPTASPIPDAAKPEATRAAQATATSVTAAIRATVQAEIKPTNTPTPVDVAAIRATAQTEARATAQTEARTTATAEPKPAAATPLATLRPTDSPTSAASKPEIKLGVNTPTDSPRTEVTSSFKFPVPTEFDPAKSNGVKNIQLDKERAPKNEWFHLKTRSGVDSYGTYWMDCSDENAFLESHGNFGQVIAQFEEKAKKARVCVGIGTLDFYTDPQKGKINVGLDNKIGNKGQNPEWPNAVNIKNVAPGEIWRVYNADSGELLGQQGGSPKGDLMVLLPEVGRRILVSELDDPAPGGGTREVLFWKGPGDDLRDRNIFDSRK